MVLRVIEMWGTSLRGLRGEECGNVFIKLICGFEIVLVIFFVKNVAGIFFLPFSEKCS